MYAICTELFICKQRMKMFKLHKMQLKWIYTLSSIKQ